MSAPLRHLWRIPPRTVRWERGLLSALLFRLNGARRGSIRSHSSSGTSRKSVCFMGRAYHIFKIKKHAGHPLMKSLRMVMSLSLNSIVCESSLFYSCAYKHKSVKYNNTIIFIFEADAIPMFSIVDTEEQDVVFLFVDHRPLTGATRVVHLHARFCKDHRECRCCSQSVHFAMPPPQ